MLFGGGGPQLEWFLAARSGSFLETFPYAMFEWLLTPLNFTHKVSHVGIALSSSKFYPQVACKKDQKGICYVGMLTPGCLRVRDCPWRHRKPEALDDLTP